MLEPLISITNRLNADRFDMSPQGSVPPVIAGGLFGIARYSIARRFEQCLRGRGIETGIIARRQVELAARSTCVVTVIIDEGAGHEEEGMLIAEC